MTNLEDLKSKPDSFDLDVCHDIILHDYEEDDEEFKQYLKDCEDWNNNDDISDFYEDVYLFEKKPRTLRAYNLHSSDYPPLQMINLGNVIMSKTKKSKQRKKICPNTIFCKSLIDSRNTENHSKCNPKKCKFVHTIEDIEFCDSSCGNITFNNNYYSGNCLKKHHKESCENYLIRNGIKLSHLNKLELYFFDKPDLDTVKNILISLKNKNYKELTIKIIEKPMDVNEFLNRNISINIEEADDSFDDYYMSLWN